MQDRHFLFVGDTDRAAEEGAHVVLPPPKVEPQREVFAEAMLEDTSTHRRRSAFDWVVAIGVHAVVLAVLSILPLYFTAGLDTHKLDLTFLAPAVMPAAPPPPLISAARPARFAPVRAFTPGKMTVPSFIPKAVAPGPISAGAPPDEALMGAVGGVPGSVPGGQLGGVLGGDLKSVPPPVAPVAAGPKVPVLVGGDVKPPRMLFGPAPDYPLLAKQAHIGGIVVIEAVIDEHGNVTGMRVISGHPMLIPSALTAVSKRKYEPTVLDGEPTPVDLRVEITFSLA